jgi:hypothetical protein
MDYFIAAWLPNVVCTLLGCVISWGIGWRQGAKAARASETHTRMLTNLLIVIEERGYLKLVRNDKGEVTGGRVYELALGTEQATLPSVSLRVGRGPAGQGTL